VAEEVGASPACSSPQGFRRRAGRDRRRDIETGGSAREIEISGDIKANSVGVAPIDHPGSIETFAAGGDFGAASGGCDKI